jgi:hypothetical protein
MVVVLDAEKPIGGCTVRACLSANLELLFEFFSYVAAKFIDFVVCLGELMMATFVLILNTSLYWDDGEMQGHPVGQVVRQHRRHALRSEAMPYSSSSSRHACFTARP